MATLLFAVLVFAFWRGSGVRELRLVLVSVRGDRELVFTVGCPGRVTVPRVREFDDRVVVSIRGVPTEQKCLAIKCLTLTDVLGGRRLFDGTGHEVLVNAESFDPAALCIDG